MHIIGVEYREDVTEYPDSLNFFSPSIHYPEYVWKEYISPRTNDVYDLVRNCFITSGLDKEKQGKSTWNPLGDYIKPGQTVLIKPNWVENKNKSVEVKDNLACLVTNPAVVRPVIDYVVKALAGNGRIILADAPMQGCCLQDMFAITGYDRLFMFYAQIGINIEIYDLRKYSVEKKMRGVFSQPKMTADNLKSVVVDLGKASMHAEKDVQHPLYKVEDYEQKMTEFYHHDGKHCYEVNTLALEADVIINMPKPKTHRLAGFTGACKNFVGITYEKASLPHRIDTDKEKSGGDAYGRYSFWKDRMRFYNEKRTTYSRNGNIFLSKLNDLIMKSCYVLGAFFSGDKYRIGSWYGNDTIWRTFVDLNNIALHCSKSGKMTEIDHRVVISIGDMIICGQKEGPVGPTPKKLGIIMFSDNNLLFDRVFCEIMGFDNKKFKMFMEKKPLEVFGYISGELESEIVKSNYNPINCMAVGNLSIPEEWYFEPNSCWKGHIEKGIQEKERSTNQ